MSNYKTPGVYVEEISTLPPSVAEVSTAIPAFIGYTEKIPAGHKLNQPVRINTLHDYETLFGKALPSRYQVTAGSNTLNINEKAGGDPGRKFLLYYSIKLYFTNGGGSCYIVPIDIYQAAKDDPNKGAPTLEYDKFKAGIDALEKVDEPTLILFPDAVNLASSTEYYQLCIDTLAQCNKLKDRFGIFDVLDTDGNGVDQEYAQAFRDSVASEFLKYGAAYMPFLKTLLSYAYDEGGDITPDGVPRPSSVQVKMPNETSYSFNGLLISYIAQSKPIPSFRVEGDGKQLVIHIPNQSVNNAHEILEAWKKGKANAPGFDLSMSGDSTGSFPKIDTPRPVALTKAIGLPEAAFKVNYIGIEDSPIVRINLQNSEDIEDDATQLPVDSSKLARFETQDGKLTINFKGSVDLSTILEHWQNWKNIETDEFDPMGFDIVSTDISTPFFSITSSQDINLRDGDSPLFIPDNSNSAGLSVTYNGTSSPASVTVEVAPNPSVKVEAKGAETDFDFKIDPNGPVLTIRTPDANGLTSSKVLQNWAAWKKTNPNQGFDLTPDENSTGSKNVVPAVVQSLSAASPVPLYSLSDRRTDIYNKIKLELSNRWVTLPPSAAMAGIYAQVDRDRGVWKAPANVPVAGITGPTQTITHEQQDRLNIDPTSGKSINVIRSFTGKGTLVWGARTLAGNDNEWRYISVRRLFITIEESVQKACAFAVFEPNDATTWLKVKAMIDNYLYGLWQQGALAGPKPAAAYFVNVGLGKTMTTQDILEGRMIVEIGIAAVRPAEFIVLKFSQKMQEA